MISVWTDGSSIYLPDFHQHVGGWAALIAYSTPVRPRLIGGGLMGVDPHRAELWGCIYALEHLRRPSDVTLYCDSRYVVSRMNGEREINTNVDLFTRLFEAAIRHRTVWTWCKSHAGDYGNETVNERAYREACQMARAARKRKRTA